MWTESCALFPPCTAIARMTHSPAEGWGKILAKAPLRSPGKYIILFFKSSQSLHPLE